jgi:4-diphosphocytidyl-2-C-methyl-D-erythritol kinase
LSENSFTLPSYAKINWTLRVLGRRADGYHEIVTVFQLVALADSLTFTPRSDGRVTLTYEGTPEIPLDETNLVVRAAQALRERYGIKQGLAVHLNKQIPVGGGLGGGSSNAAATLLGAARLWGLDTDAAALTETGAHLGADVPFFLLGGTALGTGRGTTLEPRPDVPKSFLVLVAPGVGVSTAAAYQSLNAPRLTKSDAEFILTVSREARDWADSFPNNLNNDFERVVLQQEPEIARVKDKLKLSGARAALLSGSGSSVFGLFENEAAQRRAVVWWQRHNDEKWRIFPCATVTRAEYRKELGPCAVWLSG